MLELYNTMTREKELFQPLSSPVKMFTCGPSIYSAPHVGNYRTFIWEDVLQRYLEYLGYEVKRVINLTDIEDKAIEEALVRGLPVSELTGGNAERFVAEATSLRIKLPEPIPRASTSVEQSAYLISQLLDKGYAYRHEGDIFFDPLKFKGFGKLFRLDMSKWPAQKRRFKLDTYPGRRWNLGDFILWHSCAEGDQVSWDTAIGRGRPSWNIQDPAMISENLGYSLDIFCGGIDNLYRHHDYNIAVMEAISGVELARFWIHGEHVLVGGKKMSKSLGNIVYPGDMIERGFSWEQIRFYFLSRHHRKRLNLDMDAAAQQSSRLNGLKNRATDLLSSSQSRGETQQKETVESLIDSLKLSFEEAMNNDLDVPAAVAGLDKGLQRLLDIQKSGGIGKDHIDMIERILRMADSVLQVLFQPGESSGRNEEKFNESRPRAGQSF